MESVMPSCWQLAYPLFVKGSKPAENTSPIVMGKILLSFALVASMFKIR
jgi:hypothetical protein